jgi:ribA/ribD-fused uncharacterized protein
MKFLGVDKELMESIRLSKQPERCYALGWSKPPRADWDSIRNKIMKTALVFKFSQNKELRNILIETGDKNIIQRCSKDKYWGDGYPGKGENMLGKLLMEVREELRGKIIPSKKDYENE